MVLDDLSVTLELEEQSYDLYYPPRALYELQKALKLEDARFGDPRGLLDNLRPDTLSLFVWAGALHKERKLDLASVRESLDWTRRPAVEIRDAIYRAMILAHVGSIVEAAEEPAGPRGNGELPEEMKPPETKDDLTLPDS